MPKIIISALLSNFRFFNLVGTSTLAPALAQVCSVAFVRWGTYVVFLIFLGRHKLPSLRCHASNLRQFALAADPRSPNTI